MNFKSRYTLPILVVLLLAILAVACESDTDPPEVKQIDVATATTTESQQETFSASSVEPRKCYIIGITGWDFFDPKDDRIVDTNETIAQRERINQDSGTRLLVEGIEARLGRAAVGTRMLRYYQHPEALGHAAIQIKKGYNVVLVGHSAGGAAAITVAQTLAGRETPAVGVIQLDTYNGEGAFKAPPYVYRDIRRAPFNTAVSYNYFQTESWFYRGRRDDGAMNQQQRVEVGHSDVDDYVATNFAREIAESLKSVCKDTSPTATLTPTNTPRPTATNTPVPRRPTATNTPRPRVPTATNTPVPRRPTVTNTPRPTATNTPRPQPTATNTPRPTSTPVPVIRYTLTASLDRFTYAPGDPLTLCYRLSPENVPFNLHINVSIDGGPFRSAGIIGDNGIGGGDCLGFTMGDPGQRRYILYADVGSNGTVDAEAEIFAEALVPGGGSLTGIFICEDPNYGGRCIEVTGNIPDLNVLGFNDVVSSIFIPSDLAVCVELYEHTQYTGRSRTFSSSGAGNYFVLSGFNDVTSSVQVLNGYCPPT